jgi:hypothetical protein
MFTFSSFVGKKSTFIFFRIFPYFCKKFSRKRGKQPGISRENVQLICYFTPSNVFLFFSSRRVVKPLNKFFVFKGLGPEKKEKSAEM